jgi:hypothetical protein
MWDYIQAWTSRLLALAIIVVATGVATAQTETALSGAVTVVAQNEADPPVADQAIDEDAAWREAAGPEDELGTRIRTSTILIGSDGILHCRLFRLDHVTRQEIPVKQMDVTLIRDGKEVEKTQPSEEDGRFQFGPVKPGVYSLIGYGDDGFAAFSFHVDTIPEEEPDEGVQDPLPEAGAKKKPEPVEMIHSSAIDPGDVPMALQLIRAFVGTSSGDSSGDAEADAAMEESEGAGELPLEKPAEGVIPARTFRRNPNAILSTSLSWHTVRLQPEGRLIGRILMLEPDEETGVRVVPPSDMQVFVLKEGQVVSRASCSPSGNFAIPDVKPDIYSFLAVGRDGFAALTVDVLPAEKKDEEEGTVKSASFRRVAFLQDDDTPSALTLFTTVVPPAGTNFLQEPPTIIPQPLANTDLPPLFTGGPPVGGRSGPSGTGTGINPINSPNSPSANPGGFAGGVGGGGPGGGGGGNPIPEIDPASSGVGFSVLIALLLLLVDLYRPR